MRITAAAIDPPIVELCGGEAVVTGEFAFDRALGGYAGLPTLRCCGQLKPYQVWPLAPNRFRLAAPISYELDHMESCGSCSFDLSDVKDQAGAQLSPNDPGRSVPVVLSGTCGS
jgi:hypothetical protein